MTFNISNLEYYANLTKDNLYAAIDSSSMHGTTNPNIAVCASVTGYNPSTGVVTVRVTGDMKYNVVRLFVLP